MRNSEWGMEGWMSIPHSTFRTPHWGWEDAGAPHRSDWQRTLLHPGRQFAGGWGGLVCVSWVRPARGAIPGEAARARRWASLSGRAGGAARFYLSESPTERRVGASWMTREDRL